jgi:hypothetical protein
MLAGEGPAFFWTRRALRRAGFEPVEKAILNIRVEQRQGHPIWLVERSGETGEYDSIRKLLQVIS